jgi:hypothetical protein
MFRERGYLCCRHVTKPAIWLHLGVGLVNSCYAIADFEVVNPRKWLLQNHSEQMESNLRLIPPDPRI